MTRAGDERESGRWSALRESAGCAGATTRAGGFVRCALPGERGGAVTVVLLARRG